MLITCPPTQRNFYAVLFTVLPHMLYLCGFIPFTFFRPSPSPITLFYLFNRCFSIAPDQSHLFTFAYRGEMYSFRKISKGFRFSLPDEHSLIIVGIPDQFARNREILGIDTGSFTKSQAENKKSRHAVRVFTLLESQKVLLDLPKSSCNTNLKLICISPHQYVPRLACYDSAYSLGKIHALARNGHLSRTAYNNSICRHGDTINLVVERNTLSFRPMRNSVDLRSSDGYQPDAITLIVRIKSFIGSDSTCTKKCLNPISILFTFVRILCAFAEIRIPMPQLFFKHGSLLFRKPVKKPRSPQPSLTLNPGKKFVEPIRASQVPSVTGVIPTGSDTL